MSLTVVNTIKAYRVNGAATVGDDPSMCVRSHWLDKELVVIEVFGANGDHSHPIVVRADDLRMAIENSVNTR